MAGLDGSPEPVLSPPDEVLVMMPPEGVLCVFTGWLPPGDVLELGLGLTPVNFELDTGWSDGCCEEVEEIPELCEPWPGATPPPSSGEEVLGMPPELSPTGGVEEPAVGGSVTVCPMLGPVVDMTESLP